MRFFLFPSAVDAGCFQLAEDGGAFRHHILRRLFHGRPIVDVQLGVQLRQPRGFFFQLRLLWERLAQLRLGRCKLRLHVFKPALHRFVPLRHLGEGVVDADEVES